MTDPRADFKADPPPDLRQELQAFADFAERLADAARSETLPRFRNGTAVTNKLDDAFDPVTDADREAERALRAIIARNHPDHGIIGEEFGAERAEAAWRWVLDPVDGTRAFMCGIASWATLIALEHEGAPRLGVIDQPFTDERWVGGPGGTVFRRGGAARACRTSGLRDLSAARISTTDPREAAYFTPDEAAAFARVDAASRVARFSLDAYAYGLLALGELDLVLETNLQHHDFAALRPVVEGAGGVVTDWSGAPLGTCQRGSILAAASPDLHAAALALIKG